MKLSTKIVLGFGIASTAIFSTYWTIAYGYSFENTWSPALFFIGFPNLLIGIGSIIKKKSQW